MIVYTLPDGRELRAGQPFALGDINYPRNWLAYATPEDLQALGITAEEEPPPEVSPPTLEDYARAIQTHIDATAHSKSYDSGVSCASYVSSSVPAWAAEAAAFVTWRDLVWVYAYAELERVQQEQREQPTIEEFLDELPTITWPS